MNCTIKLLGKPDDRKEQDKEKSEKENTQIISTSSDSESERGNKIFLKFGINNVNNKNKF